MYNLMGFSVENRRKIWFSAVHRLPFISFDTLMFPFMTLFCAARKDYAAGVVFDVALSVFCSVFNS